MSRTKWIAGVGLALVMAGGGLVYNTFFTAPASQALPLPQALVSLDSPAGQALLAMSESKQDFEQLQAVLPAQSRMAFCGVATLLGVQNAALKPQGESYDQQTLFASPAGQVKSSLAVSFQGINLNELAQMFSALGYQVQRTPVNAETSLARFRAELKASLADGTSFVVVNYARGVLGQAGMGHISPIGAYNAVEDKVLVMDVAKHKYPYTWVPLNSLWQAMNTQGDDGVARGYIIATR